MVVDHFIPVSRWKKLRMEGDVDDILNYMPSCPSCNYWKGAKSPGGFKKDILSQYDRVYKESAGFRNLVRFNRISRNESKYLRFYYEKYMESDEWCEAVGVTPEVTPWYKPCNPVTVADRFKEIDVDGEQ